jgi:hypothetical protein
MKAILRKAGEAKARQVVEWQLSILQWLIDFTAGLASVLLSVSCRFC